MGKSLLSKRERRTGVRRSIWFQPRVEAPNHWRQRAVYTLNHMTLNGHRTERHWSSERYGRTSPILLYIHLIFARGKSQCCPVLKGNILPAGHLTGAPL